MLKVLEYVRIRTILLLHHFYINQNKQNCTICDFVFYYLDQFGHYPLIY